ncbi:MAG: DegT/DnrJ/EryC1/StrS family aminotransferase [Fibrobacteria bacterium]|nr:DegT/DnrJ/EryC1/StrS family aminotransferase [Fibrobacteria bacterium]
MIEPPTRSRVGREDVLLRFDVSEDSPGVLGLVEGIPFFDLTQQHAGLGGELDAALSRVVRSGRCILGPEVSSFETEFAGFVGSRHAVGVGSGTDALVLSLRACGLEEGARVVTSPFTFAATASAIVQAGFVPVFADIDPASLCLDPAKVEEIPDFEAILPVHLFGETADLPALQRIARARGALVIEDAAQACGSRRGAKRAGSEGVAGCFSFFPTKNLGGAGDGGMVVTDDAEVARKLRGLRSHGASERFRHEVLGGTHRLDELQAAVLRVKLPHLERWLARRRDIARAYTSGLSGCGLRVPSWNEQRSWNQYCVRLEDRDALRAHLLERGIQCDVYYPRPLHLQPCFAPWGGGEGAFPVAEEASRTILALPIYPEMPQKHVHRVLEGIHSFMNLRSRRNPCWEFPNSPAS